MPSKSISSHLTRIYSHLDLCRSLSIEPHLLAPPAHLFNWKIFSSKQEGFIVQAGVVWGRRHVNHLRLKSWMLADDWFQERDLVERKKESEGNRNNRKIPHMKQPLNLGHSLEEGKPGRADCRLGEGQAAPPEQQSQNLPPVHWYPHLLLLLLHCCSSSNSSCLQAGGSSQGTQGLPGNHFRRLLDC